MGRYKNEPFNLPSSDEVIERVEKAESLVAINKKLKAQSEKALQLLKELDAEIEDNYMVIMKDDKKHIRIKEILKEQ